MKTIIIIFSVVAITACSKPDPVACFKDKQNGYSSLVNGQQIIQHYNVDFTSCSCYAYDHQWKFPGAALPEFNYPDGQTAPSAAYLDTGTYEVTLIVYSKNGKKTDEASEMIHVTP